MASHFRFTDSAGASATVDGGQLPVYTFPSLSPRTLKPFLTYIYTDRLLCFGCGGKAGEEEEGLSTETLMELALISDEFLLPGLQALCEWELCQPRVRASVTVSVL